MRLFFFFFFSLNKVAYITLQQQPSRTTQRIVRSGVKKNDGKPLTSSNGKGDELQSRYSNLLYVCAC